MEKDLQVNIVDEAEASSGGEDQYLSGVRNNLQATADEDKKLARTKLTEQRIKKKKRLRKMQGRDDNDEGEAIAVLGSASEEGSADEAPVESDPIVVAPVVKEAKKGKKRVKIDEGNEEDRALALLVNDNF